MKYVFPIHKKLTSENSINILKNYLYKSNTFIKILDRNSKINKWTRIKINGNKILLNTSRNVKNN